MMPNEPYDVIVVLGAQVKPDGEPSEALRRRLALALEKARERPAAVICCGARGVKEPCAEGDFMRGWLTQQGLPPERVISENRSYDTIENIENAREIMRAQGYSRALVVTSDYHVRRALAICKRCGVQAEGVGSPSVRAYWLKNHARECLAWVKFFLRLR